MSGNGRRVAFVGNRGDGERVVVDGIEGEPYKETRWPVTVSRNGAAVAFTAVWQGRRYVVVNGQRGPPLNEFVFAPRLSADGSTVAYTIGYSQVVVGEAAGPLFDDASDPVLSDDGTWHAYRADDHIILNGRKLGPFEDVSIPSLTPDGRVLVYGAKIAGRWHLVNGDQKTPVTRPIHSVFVSADGSRCGYLTLTKSGLEVIVDEQVLGQHGARQPPLFSPDAKTVAFRDGNHVLVGARKSARFDEIGPLSFSADGKHVVFGARRGRELLRVVLAVD